MQGTYRVQREDTLYSIAWRFGIAYQELARWNGIGDDFRIHVGQILVLSPLAPASNPVAEAPAPPSAQPPSAFCWPTEPQSAPRPVPGGGILIAGSLGQPVRAARAGRVVYSGSGIRGYGNLIIIKHDERYLSAYAHNRDSLVQEGDEVSLGQLIAHMGEGAPHEPVLYFEIRDNGKPIDPSVFLPTR